MQYLNSSRKELFYVLPPVIPSKGTALCYYNADLNLSFYRKTFSFLERQNGSLVLLASSILLLE